MKGPKGELSREFKDIISITIDGKEVVVKPVKETKLSQALWGTYASHVKNMISGVNEPFQKQLIIEGVGYRAEISGTNLTLLVGYSHPVVLKVPDGLTVTVEKNVVTVSGSDKEAVGQFSAQVRATRKPEPYKGKGIRYSDEVIRRKQGKRAATE